MDHLTPAQLQELTAELDRALEKLERSMRTTEEAMRPVELDQAAMGRLSRIDLLQNQGLTRNLRDREQAQLGQITSAFQRIAAGTYGQCVECGGPIAFERLQVFPETATCSAC
jgi:DnaK suppressor protein